MNDGDKTIGRCCGRPVVLKRVRAGGWTKAKREQFLTHLSESCNVRDSVAAAGMSVSSAYQLRRRDPQFRGLWQEALLEGYDHLEGLLLAHALGSVNQVEPAIPGEGEAAAPFDPKLALSILTVHRPNREGRERGGRKRARPSEAEVDAALTRQLDALARQLRKRV